MPLDDVTERCDVGRLPNSSSRRNTSTPLIELTGGQTSHCSFPCFAVYQGGWHVWAAVPFGLRFFAFPHVCFLIFSAQ